MRRTVPSQVLRRAAVLGVVLCALPITFGACSSTPPAPPSDDDTLASVKWNPTFEPDYVNVNPLPGVEPATKEQTDNAIVKDDALEFPASEASVKEWQPGKIVVAGPGEGGSLNVFGYARRVVEVTEQDGKIIVKTERLGLQDILEGEFQVRGDNDGVPIDLDKLDKEWAAENLYPTFDEVFIPRDDDGEPLVALRDDPAFDEEVDIEGAPPGSGVCCGLKKVGKAIGGAAKAVASATATGVKAAANTVTNVVAAVTPTDFNGSVNLDSNIGWPETNTPLFTNMEFKKTIKRKNVGIELFIKGDASVKSRLTLNPGFQLGARIPNPINKNAPPFKTWMNIDSRVETRLGFKVNLEAGVRAVEIDGRKLTKGTKEFIERVDNTVNTAQEVYSATRESLTGDKDLKPEATFTKVLWISKPKLKTFMAGPVPVVLTSTLQVNLVCGFEAKASLSANLEWGNTTTFKFRAEYESGKGVTATAPAMERVATRSVEVLGGGQIVAHCGLVPRVNAFVYDTAGFYTGVRGSLVASAGFESKCQATTTKPKGELELKLTANVGIQLGARLQVPGSSAAGKNGSDLGIETPPFEPYNKEWELYSKKWEFPNGGLGYCTPLCQNGRLDVDEAKETDVDCGGGACTTCAAGKRCSKTSDCDGRATCNGGVCAVQPCFNRVRDGAESGVDCGGSCAQKCATGDSCNTGNDCTSGFCSLAKRCVANSCSDGVRSGRETGVDCGGPDCGKCGVGVITAVASDCASGFHNGMNCVATSCEDRVRSGAETDRDCGGASPCARCAVGLACAADGDCQGGLRCNAGRCERIPAPTCTDRIRNQNETDIDCGGTCPKCTTGQRCALAADCASAVCTQGVCRAPACTDGVRNGVETDIDCGGPTGGAQSCGRCTAGRACTQGADCASGVCNSGRCAGAYTVSATVSGYVNAGAPLLVLRNNGENVTVTQNGVATFSTLVAEGATYAVSVVTQPLGQTCVVGSGSGTMGSANVTNVTVTCTPNTYRLGGEVTGLVGSVTLRNAGGNETTVTQNGPFTFTNNVAFRSAIDVTVSAQPAGQTCTVTQGGTGLMPANDLTTGLVVTCASQSFSVGGNVSGLNGTVVLRNNSGNDLTRTQNGAFTFGASQPFNTSYAVTVHTQPAGQNCVVTNGTGTIGAGNVTNVAVTCTNLTYSVGGSISGLVGTLVLRNNGGNDLTRTQNGAFTFSTPVAFGSPYAVTVQTQPAGQTCSVAQGSGTMGAGNVTGVAVTCVGNPYTVGGTVSGLGGSESVVLQNNGGNNLTVSANGNFTFTQSVLSGAAYAVTVLTPPAGKTCGVTNGSGTMGAANVTNVSVACTGTGGTPPTGGFITTLDGLNIHTFTGGGTFQTFDTRTVEYLIVAGGGGGGSGDGGGGGGGGVITGTVLLPPGTYPIVVGSGGAGAGVGELGSASQNGGNSSFNGFVAIGGGRGGQEDNFTSFGPLNNGGAGGSGGGFGGANAAAASIPSSGGAGTNGQGFAGGTRATSGATVYYGMGGGGGAGGPGGNGTTANRGGDGGVGIGSNINGTLTFYGGGGGGSGRGVAGGSGGQGGGGAGGLGMNTNGENGAPNTGGGGGGGGDQASRGGNGGSGIVILRYATGGPPAPRVDCEDILEAGQSTGNGIYTIDPDGPEPTAPFEVYCDMANGGWTQVIDNDIALGYRLPTAWLAGLTTTPPNGGQWSVAQHLDFFVGPSGAHFSLRWNPSENQYVNWTQSMSPRQGRGTISDVMMVPAGQNGYGGAFQGFAYDGDQRAAFDGEPGGAYAWAIGTQNQFGAGVPKWASSSLGGAEQAQRVRLYVRRAY